MSKVDRGTTAVTVCDKEYTLKPTLGALRKIQTRFGGLRGALEALAALNIDHATNIIIAGADLDIGKKGAEALAEDVFDQGIADVIEQITPFVSALFNPRGEQSDDSGKASQAGSD